MAVFILCMAFALYWLGKETKWLTIRLEKPPQTFMDMVLGAIGIVLYATMFGNVDEFEVWLSDLWKKYRRKQPPHYIATI